MEPGDCGRPGLNVLNLVTEEKEADTGNVTNLLQLVTGMTVKGLVRILMSVMQYLVNVKVCHFHSFRFVG